MNKAFRFGIIFIALTAAISTFGTGTSWAKDPYAGQTYAVASGKISERGYVPVISTIVGDQLSTDDCIVTSSRKATFAKTDNFGHDKDFLVSLNCSAKLAHDGEPGNSLASPQGRAEKKIEDRAAKYNAKPDRCKKSLEACKEFCDKNVGLCSNEVLALF